MAEPNTVDDVVDETLTGPVKDVTRGCFGVIVFLFSGFGGLFLIALMLIKVL